MPPFATWIRLLRGVFSDVFYCLSIAGLPTLKAIWNKPSLIFNPRQLSQTFMAKVWEPFGDGIDQNSRQEKEDLILPWATGVIFEIGAAHGHLAKYLDKYRVTAYVALEPNELMHERLRNKASESGFKEEDGTFLLIPSGAEEVEKIEHVLQEWALKWRRDGKDGRVVDSLVSILTFCSLPPCPTSSWPVRSSTPPADTIRGLQTRILRPGGQLLFYEHVRSSIPAIARAQDFLSPVWRSVFDGCTIGVDSVRAVWEAGFDEGEFTSGAKTNGSVDERMKSGYGLWTEKDGVRFWEPIDEKEGGWAEMRVWGNKGEDPESLFWHQSGRCVKRH
ncbi:uncharacterized protein FOMMEDRAFT_111878 [Fomitiporia mediterranea MF3/22]|uniref:uncharacterized protein n=1 Tax=Fomitiporia mediterranea (strain MF3/22) TaxID=694068 RepID=UPI0004408241|nr:uncharacterized protein FOMMEDRAFT_111878 [Fomitiporia mediterranea MF3/22]EJD00328.1 hypothetical protein FOMMEDRAFT_111878 [Fomitiporia mediterranea MF3/22]